MKKPFFKPFIIILVIACLAVLFFLFRPFLIEIIIAAAIVSVFYKPYEKLAKVLWNKKYLASFIMCLLLLLIVIIPVSRFMIYTGQKASTAFTTVSNVLNQADLIQSNLFNKLNVNGSGEEILKTLVIDVTSNIKNWLVSGTSAFVKGTTDFIVSLAIIILTMFFFFVEGRNLAMKVIKLSPLPTKYDMEIIKKFRAVSRTTFISVFVTAFTQGLLGAIGFLIIGWPFIFVFIIMAFLSLIPYIGSSIFYVPASIYLILTGQIWQGIFILAWCFIVVSNIDEIIRAYIIKGKAEVNPIFVVFAIIGGISLFGFWGVIVGPLIISLAATIFHIYELEFNNSLEG